MGKPAKKAEPEKFDAEKELALALHERWRRGNLQAKTASASIYVLIDPVTRAIRYVGKANDPIKRLQSHIRDSRTRNRPVCNWIGKLVSQGLEPILHVLIPNAPDWRAAEILAIERCKAAGCDLLNLAKGGDDIPCSKETRKKNANRLQSFLKTGQSKRGSQASRESMVKYGYNSALKLAIRAGNKAQTDRIHSKMRERAEAEPQHFGAWKDVGLESCQE